MGNPSFGKLDLDFEWKKTSISIPELGSYPQSKLYKLILWSSESWRVQGRDMNFHCPAVHSSNLPSLCCDPLEYTWNFQIMSRWVCAPHYMFHAGKIVHLKGIQPSSHNPTDYKFALSFTSLGLSVFLIGRERIWEVSLFPMQIKNFAMSRLQSQLC